MKRIFSVTSELGALSGLVVACSSSGGLPGATVGTGADAAATITGGAVTDAAGDAEASGAPDGAVTQADAGQDGAAGTDSGADSSAASSTPSDGGLGIITISPYVNGNGPPLEVLATFDPHPTPAVVETLLTVDAGGGSCSVTTVHGGAINDGGCASLTSAGTLTVTGGTAPIVITAALADSCEYDSLAAELQALKDDAAGPGTIFPGDTLTITATGATAPAFSTTIGVPNDITITQPDLLPDASSLVVVNSQDLPLAWSGAGPAGHVNFMVYQGDNAVTCTFPESAGSGVVPASVLSYLTPGIGAGGIGSSSTEDIDAGGWSIEVTVSGQTNFSPTGVTVVGSADAGTAIAPDAGTANGAEGCPALSGDTCTALENIGAEINADCAADAPPAMTGGAITPGSYVLASDVWYVPPEFYDSGLCSQAPEGPTTILIGGGCIQVASVSNLIAVGATLAPGGNINTTNGSMLYTQSGNAITTTPSCNANPNQSAVSTTTYTASPTSVTFLNDYGDNLLELTTFLLANP